MSSLHITNYKAHSLPCKKHICVLHGWTSDWSALRSKLARLSLFKSDTDPLPSSSTTTGENSPLRSRPNNDLSGTSHSRLTAELLDLRLSMEFQLTLRDSRMWVLEKARKGRQSNTTQPPEVKSSAGVPRMCTSSFADISNKSLLPMTDFSLCISFDFTCTEELSGTSTTLTKSTKDIRFE